MNTQPPSCWARRPGLASVWLHPWCPSLAGPGHHLLPGDCDALPLLSLMVPVLHSPQSSQGVSPSTDGATSPSVNAPQHRCYWNQVPPWPISPCTIGVLPPGPSRKPRAHAHLGAFALRFPVPGTFLLDLPCRLPGLWAPQLSAPPWRVRTGVIHLLVCVSLLVAPPPPSVPRQCEGQGTRELWAELCPPPKISPSPNPRHL